MKLKINQSEIELIQGDITESDTDAIVNPANDQLILGAGVAGAIRIKGGASIQEECRAIGHCPVGGAVITGGGNLKARHVIHAVGPRQGEGDEETKLKNATLNSLKVAEENKLMSITFPAISTGIFGFPLDACARIMLTTTRDYLTDNTNIKHVVFALFDEESFKAFEDQLKTMQDYKK
jgi:O-acetyl-ADP-ribose deacetylase (regulator of RNase III)